MPRTSAQDLQEEFLTTIRKGQENVLDALKAWVETVRTVTPKLPIVNVPFADKLPNVAAPFADRVKLPSRPNRRMDLFQKNPLADPLPALSSPTETAPELIRPSLCVQAR